MRIPGAVVGCVAFITWPHLARMSGVLRSQACVQLLQKMPGLPRKLPSIPV